MDTNIELYISELVFVPNFTLNKQFWIFGPSSPKVDGGKIVSELQWVDMTWAIKSVSQVTQKDIYGQK